MTKVLCIETASTHCNVALHADGQNYVSALDVGRTHNIHLLPHLQTLFERAGIMAMELECIAFGCGPGSFTGVRLAAAATQALALAADARVLGLKNSRLLAASVPAAELAGRAVLSCIRSRGESYYLGVWQDDQVLREDALCDAAPDWLQSLTPADVLLAGVRPPWLPEALVQDVAAPLILPTAMLEVALGDYRAGLHNDAEMALPVYLHGDSPWRPSHA